jgi:hypothetical protein
VLGHSAAQVLLEVPHDEPRQASRFVGARVGAARAIDWIRGKMSNDQHYVSKAVDALPWLTQRLGGKLPKGAAEAARELDRQHERGEPRHRWPSKRVV